MRASSSTPSVGAAAVAIWARFGLSVLIAGAMPFPAQGQAPDSGPHQPISLAQLLERVHSRYPEIGAANARLNSARGARRAAGVFPNPVIGVGLENVALPGRGAAISMDREATVWVPMLAGRVSAPDSRLAGGGKDQGLMRINILLIAFFH